MIGLLLLTQTWVLYTLSFFFKSFSLKSALQYNPVDLALQLMNNLSNGEDFDNFWDTEVMLSRALKDSVDRKLYITNDLKLTNEESEYFHAFAAAVPHHSTLLSRLGAVQDYTRDLKVILQEAKYSLGNKRSDLVQLWSRNQILEEMLKLLDQM